MDKLLRIDARSIVSQDNNKLKIKITEQSVLRLMVRANGSYFGRYTASTIERALVIGHPYTEYISLEDFRFKKYKRLGIAKDVPNGIYDVYRISGIEIENDCFAILYIE